MSALKDKFKEAVRVPSTSTGYMIQQVVRERHDLRDVPFYVPSVPGHNAETLIAGEEVFKFFSHEILDMRAEATVQKYFQSKIDGVPQVTYIGKSANFFGMEYIDGTSLQSCLPKMTQPQLDQLAQDIAGFKTQLNTASLKTAFNDIELRRDFQSDNDLQAQMLVMLESPKLRRVFRENEILAELDQSAAVLAKRPYVANHNDIRGANIIMDEGTMRVKAFLDFGIASKERLPETEFNGLDDWFAHYDLAFSQKVRESYFPTQPALSIHSDLLISLCRTVNQYADGSLSNVSRNGVVMTVLEEQVKQSAKYLHSSPPWRVNP